MRWFLYVFYWQFLAKQCCVAFTKAGIDPKVRQYGRASAWHIHHAGTTPSEPITVSIMERIDYIVAHKPINEVSRRLKLLRPVSGWFNSEPVTFSSLREYTDAIMALHEQQCPNCPWTPQTQTIFPEHKNEIVL